MHETDLRYSLPMFPCILMISSHLKYFVEKKGNIEKKRFKFKSAVDAKTHLIFSAKDMPE